MKLPFKSPIFIVGCPRSGTTLLQQMLDAHPAVAIAPETHFMQYFWQQRDCYGDLNQDVNYRRLIQEVIAVDEFAEMGLSADEFSEAAWKNARTYAAVFGLLLKQFASIRGVRIVGEKTPNHVLYMSKLKEFFPSACFIQIVRDPRAVVNSWRAVPWSTGNLAGDAEVWRSYVLAARRSPAEVKSSLFTLSYEQLVAAPEENLRLLCLFLNLEFVPEMLSYHQKELQLVNVTREPWKAKAVEPVSHEPMTRWQKELSEKMIAEIEAVVWFEMKRLGYQVQTNLLRLLPTAAAVTMVRKLKRFFSLSSHLSKKTKMR